MDLDPSIKNLPDSQHGATEGDCRKVFPQSGKLWESKSLECHQEGWGTKWTVESGKPGMALAAGSPSRARPAGGRRQCKGPVGGGGGRPGKPQGEVL